MSDDERIPIIGLVGGVGSGKTAVARRLAERRHVVVVDGDQAGHAALQVPEVKQQIRQRFEESVFDEHGEVDRAALGRRVFGNGPEQQQARADLERIVHPHIRSELRRRIHEAQSADGVEAVILDAAVLLEAGWDDLCDRVVFVDVPEAIRRERVTRRRGWTDDEWALREASQLSLQAKRQAADQIIDNGGDLDDAGRAFELILNHWSP